MHPGLFTISGYRYLFLAVSFLLVPPLFLRAMEDPLPDPDWKEFRPRIATPPPRKKESPPGLKPACFIYFQDKLLASLLDLLLNCNFPFIK